MRMEDASLIPDKTILLDIVRMQMPFGKYKGRLIKDLPLYYLEWLASKGFSNTRIGQILSTTFEIKTNGLEFLLDGLE
ncbi:MAG: DNA polymerase III subunit epsilon [Bacteroidetes bacterium OLB9]|nr:MAG: DNA polymerase III subunit epsilon [Bacteroidetes bacterium OLB9]